MRRKLTLNGTWTYCLEMWRWIAKARENGNTESVDALKRQWLYINGLDGDIDSDCFFCEYASRREFSCAYCPGAKVDKRFCCTNNEYHFETEPIAFYKELLRLNKIRKGKK